MRTVLACTGKVRSIPILQDEVIVDKTLTCGFCCAEADEAYVIGKRGQYTPVGAYLAGDEIIKIALEHGAQMIHPGEFAQLLFYRHFCAPTLARATRPSFTREKWH